METNKLYSNGNTVVRLLKLNEKRALIINCLTLNMPTWIPIENLSGYQAIDNTSLYIGKNGVTDIDNIEPKRLNIMYKRFTVISNVLPYIDDEIERANQIDISAKLHNVCKQSIRKYLCIYLAYKDVRALIPEDRKSQRELTDDEKNMRWSLNKHFYNSRRNTLSTAYKMMLKERYCDSNGLLLPTYPTFFQYRYFYRKTKKLQNFYITRNGLSDYQRNKRPCVGDGVRDFANSIGCGMVDSTVCDIYLVNSSGELIGRPILTACIDAYSGLCCGYSLLWEGGVYSLREMMLNVITDKVEHCRKHGMVISKNEWPSKELPGIIVSDQGKEYVGDTFEQISEVGVTLVNLPPFRPELKGPIEKMFDLIQNGYKPYLKGNGIIEPDFQERGAHDYRKDACLTLAEFEKIVLKCILHHNARHIVENFPFTQEMLDKGVKPYSNDIWLWGIKQEGANLITISKEQLALTLLPRTEGRFDRFGLHVNKMRYRSDGYTERYLAGGTAIVAYNPDNVSFVWLIENGKYVKFELIEKRFADRNLLSVETLLEQQTKLIKEEKENELQAEINLANDIGVIVSDCIPSGKVQIKKVKQNRIKEAEKERIKHWE